MKRNKFNVLIIDTETCFKNEHSHLIYDIGWTVGNILDPSEEPKSRRFIVANTLLKGCLLYTSPSPRDATLSRMPSSA